MFALLAAACGGRRRRRFVVTSGHRGRRGSTEGGTATTAAGETAETTGGGDDATTGGDAAAPEGEPIKVMVTAPVDTQLPPYPNIPGAAEVYEQYINANGGVAGRPLDVITCDNKGEPNEGANCARQAVEEGVVAVVGSFTFDASRIIPVLEEANIAWFGACCPLVAQEFTSEISYVLGSLLPGMGAGLGWKMAQDGCENPVNVVIDIPAGDVAFPALKAAYEVGGGDPDDVDDGQDPGRCRRTTAPRWRRPRTTPTASPAASPTPTGPPGSRRWRRPVPTSACTACRAT